MMEALSRRISEEATDARVDGKLDEADALEWFASVLRGVSGPGGQRTRTPVALLLLESVTEGDVAREFHEKHCTCTRCPHCDEVIED